MTGLVYVDNAEGIIDGIQLDVLDDCDLNDNDFRLPIAVGYDGDYGMALPIQEYKNRCIGFVTKLYRREFILTARLELLPDIKGKVNLFWVAQHAPANLRLVARMHKDRSVSIGVCILRCFGEEIPGTVYCKLNVELQDELKEALEDLLQKDGLPQDEENIPQDCNTTPPKKGFWCRLFNY